MAGAGAWLAGLMGPLSARVLMALGFQVVTIKGMDLVLDQIKALALAQLGQVHAAGLQMALLGGIGTALGIIFGAIATRLALWQIAQGTRILGGGGN